jgi:hypothetical protein
MCWLGSCEIADGAELLDQVGFAWRRSAGVRRWESGLAASGVGLSVDATTDPAEKPAEKKGEGGARSVRTNRRSTSAALGDHACKGRPAVTLLRRRRAWISAKAITPLPIIANLEGSGTKISFGRTRVWEPLGFVAVRLTV